MWHLHKTLPTQPVRKGDRMRDEYDMHTSERIRNLGKNSKPAKKLVGIRITILCLVLSVGVYTFVKNQNQGSEAPIVEVVKSQWSQQSPVLLVIAGALILLCILVAVLIKVIKSKQQD